MRTIVRRHEPLSANTGQSSLFRLDNGRLFGKGNSAFFQPDPDRQTTALQGQASCVREGKGGQISVNKRYGVCSEKRTGKQVHSLPLNYKLTNMVFRLCCDTN